MSAVLMHCKDCRWRDAQGYCDNEHLFEGRYADNSEDEKNADCLVYSYQEGGSFWVGPEFGCVHWEPRIVDVS